MFPVLVKIGPIMIYSYGCLLGVAFAITTILAMRRAPKEQIKPEVVIDLAIWLLLYGIVGARLLYIAENFDYFYENPIEMILIFKGGLVVYGAIIFAFLGGLVFVKVYKQSFWPLGDLISPYIALGQAIGRIGCFMNGCCYGKVTDVSWAVKLPGHYNGIHPTQLYESGAMFMVFAVMLLLRSKKKFAGQLFLIYWLFYPVIRFTVDLYRADQPPILLNLTLSQLMSIAIFSISFVILVLKSKNQR